MSFTANFLHNTPRILRIDAQICKLIIESILIIMRRGTIDENKIWKKILKELVNEFAIKKAGANCAGFMYEVKKPESIKRKSIECLKKSRL